MQSAGYIAWNILQQQLSELATQLGIRNSKTYEASVLQYLECMIGQ